MIKTVAISIILENLNFNLNLCRKLSVIASIFFCELNMMLKFHVSLNYDAKYNVNLMVEYMKNLM